MKLNIPEIPVPEEKPPYRIPFNRASLMGREIEYILQAISNGHISGDGSYTRKSSRLLEETLGAARTLLTTSCTHALEMAALLLEIRPGDEVIIPAFTFVSTVNAFVLRGARPVFIDIRADTKNLDEAQLEKLISPKTRAITPVHYAGVGCEMDAIVEIAKQYGIAVVEDNAHGLFGKYKGKYLGTFGAMGAQSFHETKNFTCGEGGALLINDPRYIEEAEIIREKGTNRSRFFRGLVDKYTWVNHGSSYLLSEVLAAFLYAQLQAWQEVQTIRRRIWDGYYQSLAAWAERAGVGLPVIPAHCEQSYHMFYLILPSLEKRTALINHLKSKSILSVFHYLPLNVSPMGKRYGYEGGECPVTEDISDRLLRLPFYNSLQSDDQACVVKEIVEVAKYW